MTDDQRRAFVHVWFDGEPMEDMGGRVLEVEAEERANDTSAFRIVLDMSPSEEDWDVLTDERFRLLHRVTIAFGLGDPGAEEPDTEQVVFDGYTTVVEPVFGKQRTVDSQLELSGLDAFSLMHFEDRTRAWSGLADSAIAEQIYGEYGFAAGEASIETTTPLRDADRATMLQRTTDAEFVRMLARRNGFEAYVERDETPVSAGAHPGTAMVGHFHLPRTGADIQPELSLAPQTNPTIVEMRVRWESHRPTHVVAGHIDERTRRLRTTEIDAPRFRRLGGSAGAPAEGVSRAEILAARLPVIIPSRSDVRAVGLQAVDVPHDATEVENLAWAEYREADWLALATAVVRGVRYPQILRARRPVDIAGAGALLSGTWYVQSTCHRWSWRDDTAQYDVDVELVRNVLNEVG